MGTVVFENGKLGEQVTKIDLFCEYLKTNGFIPGSQTGFDNTMYFFKKDIGVMISSNYVDFGRFHVEVDGKRAPGCNIIASFTGLDLLDLNGWKMLLHITGIVHMKGIDVS